MTEAIYQLIYCSRTATASPDETGRILAVSRVNNARDGKLLTAFWRDSFVKRRCLIPVSQWAEAEGEAGSKTRTWYRLAGHELFAVAGLWRRDDIVRVDLTELTYDDVDSLLHLALGGPVDRSAVDRVWAASAGNALFVRELVLGALARGVAWQD